MPIERLKGFRQDKHPRHTEKTHRNENKRLKIYIKMKEATLPKATDKRPPQKSESERQDQTPHRPQPQHCERTARQKIIIFKNNKKLFTARPAHQKTSVFKNNIKPRQLHESPPKNSNI